MKSKMKGYMKNVAAGAKALQKFKKAASKGMTAERKRTDKWLKKFRKGVDKFIKKTEKGLSKQEAKARKVEESYKEDAKEAGGEIAGLSEEIEVIEELIERPADLSDIIQSAK